MNAPDKIYMPNELLSEEWQRHIEGQDTAYIREDALYGYLEKELKWADGIQTSYYIGMADALKNIINKIKTI